MASPYAGSASAMAPGSPSAGRRWYSAGTASTNLATGGAVTTQANPQPGPRTHDRMNALDLTLIRIGFLVVLWLFVIAAVGVIRTDLFGQSSARARRRAAAAVRLPRP